MIKIKRYVNGLLYFKGYVKTRDLVYLLKKEKEFKVLQVTTDEDVTKDVLWDLVSELGKKSETDPKEILRRIK